MEKKLGVHRVYIGIMGNILGLYGDNGPENGNYYRRIIGSIRVYIGIMEKRTESTIV